MITIETHIEFLYLFFFYTFISTNFLTTFQISPFDVRMITHRCTGEPKLFICRWSCEQEFMTLQNGKTMGLDMIISSTDIDQRQGACLVEGKHLKAFKPFKFHFKRFIFFVLLEKIDRLKKYCHYHWMMQHIKII